MIHSGLGLAFYRYNPELPLYLAGVTINDETGLSGDFDSDIMAHVVGDAVLGAAGLGSMQQQFDVNDKKYQDISGMKLLELVRIKLDKLSLEVVNLDLTLIADGLDLSSVRTMIIVNLQHALNLENGSVSIKVSSSFYPLIANAGDGIAALVICSVREVYEEEEEELDFEDQEDEEDYYELRSSGNPEIHRAAFGPWWRMGLFFIRSVNADRVCVSFFPGRCSNLCGRIYIR
jgi:2-C-methyl-D-erythritol 2,4-cyclodiphosphate synthase